MYLRRADRPEYASGEGVSAAAFAPRENKGERHISFTRCFRKRWSDEDLLTYQKVAGEIPQGGWVAVFEVSSRCFRSARVRGPHWKPRPREPYGWSHFESPYYTVSQREELANAVNAAWDLEDLRFLPRLDSKSKVKKGWSAARLHHR